MTSNKPLAKVRFPSRAYQLKQIRCVVNNAIKTLALPSKNVDQIVLAINEACMNIIQHGYGAGQVGEIVLEILLLDNEILFRLSDFAKPIDVKKIKSRDLNDVRPGGLGVHFINEIMDEVQYLHKDDGSGNVLEMKKYIK